MVIAVALSLAVTAVAQADQTDDYIRTQMKRQRIPGLSLVVLRDGKIIKAAGYGLANVKLDIPATPETVYKIGSVGKQFIATGIMLLVQDRKLGLDDPIGKFLEGTPPTWNGITIRHLLTHTSGMVTEAPGFEPFRFRSDADVVRTAYPVPLHFEPGEKWEYCNTSYFALADVIRKVAGRPWDKYLSDRVFKPAGMNATRTTTTTESVPNRAVGYTDNDKLQDATDWPAVRPSGAFLSTVLDLAKWDALLYTNSILTDSTRRQMWTPVTLNDGTSYPYGLGWAIDSVKGHREVHHSGGIPGFLSEFARFVDDRLTVAVLLNLDDADVKTIARDVATLYLPPPEPAPAAR
ncbi:MAG: serine hydrolase domain-containing protein [Acidobacteriota bacterium]